ncbi:hypothetical protein VTI74DRAFT_9978 [Chaetomium olivicolor]
MVDMGRQANYGYTADPSSFSISGQPTPVDDWAEAKVQAEIEKEEQKDGDPMLAGPHATDCFREEVAVADVPFPAVEEPHRSTVPPEAYGPAYADGTPVRVYGPTCAFEPPESNRRAHEAAHARAASQALAPEHIRALIQQTHQTQRGRPLVTTQIQTTTRDVYDVQGRLRQSQQSRSAQRPSTPQQQLEEARQRLHQAQERRRHFQEQQAQARQGRASQPETNGETDRSSPLSIYEFQQDRLRAQRLGLPAPISRTQTVIETQQTHPNSHPVGEPVPNHPAQSHHTQPHAWRAQPQAQPRNSSNQHPQNGTRRRRSSSGASSLRSMQTVDEIVEEEEEQLSQRQAQQQQGEDGQDRSDAQTHESQEWVPTTPPPQYEVAVGGGSLEPGNGLAAEVARAEAIQVQIWGPDLGPALAPILARHQMGLHGQRNERTAEQRNEETSEEGNEETAEQGNRETAEQGDGETAEQSNGETAEQDNEETRGNAEGQGQSHGQSDAQNHSQDDNQDQGQDQGQVQTQDYAQELA